MRLSVTKILKDSDLTLIELSPECTVKISELGIAFELEEAFLVNDIHIIRCKVINAGASLLYLGFRCLDIPESRYGGSPILHCEGNWDYVFGDAGQLHGNCNLFQYSPQHGKMTKDQKTLS